MKCYRVSHRYVGYEKRRRIVVVHTKAPVIVNPKAIMMFASITTNDDVIDEDKNQIDRNKYAVVYLQDAENLELVTDKEDANRIIRGGWNNG